MPTHRVSLRSSAVKFGRTVSSISFSRNAASYFPRPRLRSQTTTVHRSAPRLWVPHMIFSARESVQGSLNYGSQRTIKTAEVISRLAGFIADFKNTAVALKS